ncbi:MAG: hypothetical protein V5A72_03320 [Candidatus Nanohaloarchaea archaeon]
MVGANTNQANQNSSAGQKSLKDRIDYDKLGDYAPENDIEERILDNAFNSLEQAMELNQEYIDRLRNPYDEAREMVRQYKEFYKETGLALDPEQFMNLYPEREEPEFLGQMRDLYWDNAKSALDLYLDLKEENQIEQFYKDWLDSENSDEGNKAGPVIQQGGIQDMVDQFLDNPANKN